MAVTSNTLIGRSRGKVGGAVFTTWKGINVLKEKPLTVANPKSPSQVQRRGKFSSAVKVARELLGLSRITFKEEAIKKSEYNAFISQNIELMSDQGTGIDVAQIANFKAGKGSLINSAFTQMPSLVGNNATILWSNAGTPPEVVGTDRLYICYFNNTKHTFKWITPPDTRSAESATVALQDITLGDLVFFFAGFYSTEGKASDSVYLGESMAS